MCRWHHTPKGWQFQSLRQIPVFFILDCKILSEYLRGIVNVLKTSSLSENTVCILMGRASQV